MGGASLIRAEVGVGGGVIIENGVEIRDVSKMEDKMGNFSGESVCVTGSGLIDIERGNGLRIDERMLRLARSEARETFNVRRQVTLRNGETTERLASGEEVIPEAIELVSGGGTVHVRVILAEIFGAVFFDGGESIAGATSVNDGTIERNIPLEVINAERTDGADDGRGILENGGKAGDAGLGDSLEDDLS